MALVFEVADDAVAAEVALAQDILHFQQVLLLQGRLKQVVSVVYLDLLELSRPVKRKHQILHKLLNQ